MADLILAALTSGEGELYALLLAQMQSGKTGTYLRVALEGIFLGIFEKVHIICGSRDVALREQTRGSLKVAIKSFAIDKIPTDSGAYESLKEKLTDSIQVFWNQDLKDLVVDSKCLIINDESHVAQSKGNIPYKNFWKKSGLEKCLYGDFSPLREMDIRILSVSATSFSECVQNQKVVLGVEMETDVQLSEKNVFIMDPGPSYTGVAKFLEEGSIHFESEPISVKTGGRHLRSILSSPKYDGKYCVVRTARADLDSALMKGIAEEAGVIYKPVYGDKIGESLKFMSKKPNHTTLVHICGIARMGQVIDKEYLGFVYEQSGASAIDTLLQSLLGRVCGHDANTDIDIYITEKREEEVRMYAKAVESSAEECRAMFSKMSPALNVKGSKSHKHTFGSTVQDQSGAFWRKLVPIKFPMNLFGEGFDKREITANDLLDLFDSHPELLVGNSDTEFIMDKLSEEPEISLRNLDKPAYKERGTAKTLDKAISQGKRSTECFTNVVCKHLTEEVKAFTILRSKKNPKDVYFIGFAPHPTMTEEDWECLNGLKDTLPKCNYNPAHVVVKESGEKMQSVNGGQIVKFPEETSRCPVALCENLRMSIQISMDYPNAEREITSQWCNESEEYNGIRFYKAQFTQEDIEQVKGKLEQEFGITINFKGREFSKWFRYKSISW